MLCCLWDGVYKTLAANRRDTHIGSASGFHFCRVGLYPLLYYYIILLFSFYFIRFTPFKYCHSSQCLMTDVTKAVVCIILSMG